MTQAPARTRPFALRALIFGVRVVGYFFLASYFFLGIAFTWGWAETQWIRHKPIDTLYERVEAARSNNDLSGALRMVNLQPLDRSQEVLDQMLPHAGKLESGFFFELARRHLYLGKAEEAVFWAQLGRLRLRFDFLRCNHQLSRELSDQFVNLATPAEIAQYLADHPQDMVPILKKVLIWDEQNPPPRAMLFDCNILDNFSQKKSTPLPEDSWDKVREGLRRAAQTFIDSEEKNKEEKTDTPAP